MNKLLKKDDCAVGIDSVLHVQESDESQEKSKAELSLKDPPSEKATAVLNNEKEIDKELRPKAQ